MSCTIIEKADFSRIARILAGQIWDIADAKGWHEEEKQVGTDIALMHAELSEALEALRVPGSMDKHLPEHVAHVVELADVIIRILHFCEKRQEIGALMEAVFAKVEYNATRKHKHGGKKF